MLKNLNLNVDSKAFSIEKKQKLLITMMPNSPLFIPNNK